MFKTYFINKNFSHHTYIHFCTSIFAASSWPCHELMNMGDLFTYCTTLAKQTGSLKEAFASSIQDEITVGNCCLLRVQTGDQGKCFEIFGEPDLLKS